MSTKKKGNKTKIVGWLTGVTLAYAVLFGLLVFQTGPCSLPDGIASLEAATTWNPFRLYLSCISINELGDALAGAFAPVAFLWLAGAVLIQSKELEAQREELSSTREVMQQQVNEMQVSTALLAKQTEAIEDERKRRDEEHADRVYDALYIDFMDWLKSQADIILRFEYEVVTHGLDVEPQRGMKPGSARLVNAAVIEPLRARGAHIVIGDLDLATAQLTAFKKNTVYFEPNSHTQALLLARRIDQLLDAAERVSAHKSYSASPEDVRNMHLAAERLVEQMVRVRRRTTNELTPTGPEAAA